MSKKKNATMAFAVMSTASLLGFTAPGEVTAQNERPENPEKAEVFPAWDQQLAPQIQSLEAEKATFDPAAEDGKRVAALQEESVKLKEAGTSFYSEPQPQSGSAAFSLVDDPGYDGEMHSYYKFLGELMFHSNGDDGKNE